MEEKPPVRRYVAAVLAALALGFMLFSRYLEWQLPPEAGANFGAGWAMLLAFIFGLAAVIVWSGPHRRQWFGYNVPTTVVVLVVIALLVGAMALASAVIRMSLP